MTRIQRNSLLCPNCRKLISADEPLCPYCGIARPGSWWKNNSFSKGFSSADQLIKTIVFTNIGMFFITLLFNPTRTTISFNPFTLLAPGDNSLLLLGATGTIPIDRLHRWWTLVSANYLHGSILHIFFNMMVLKQLAPLVIREYGKYRMFTIYTLSGIIGFWVSYLAGVKFTIGASAAICGLMGALLYYGKSRGGIYGRIIYKQIGGWVIGIFLFGLIVPGINNWGHGGGLISGALIGFLLGYQEKKRETLLCKTLSTACVMLTILILAWAIVSSIYYRIMP